MYPIFVLGEEKDDVVEYMDKIEREETNSRLKNWYEIYFPLANIINELDFKYGDVYKKDLKYRLKKVKLSKRIYNKIINMKKGIKYEDLVKFSKIVDGEFCISLRGDFANIPMDLENDIIKIAKENKSSVPKTINDILRKYVENWRKNKC